MSDNVVPFKLKPTSLQRLIDALTEQGKDIESVAIVVTNKEGFSDVWHTSQSYTELVYKSKVLNVFTDDLARESIVEI